MLATVKNIRGLNTRSNNINPSEDSSLCMLNVYKDSNGNIRKVQAFDDMGLVVSDILDAYYYSHNNEILLFGETTMYRVVSLDTAPAIEIVPSIFADRGYVGSASLNWSERLSFAESGKVLYIADPSGTEELMKYDGKYVCRAGTPRARVYSTSGSGAYIRAIISYKFNSGVEYFGDYEQVAANPGSNTSIVMNVPGFVWNPAGPNHDYIAGSKYPMKGGVTAFGGHTISGALFPTSTTIAFTSHTFEVGDIIWGKKTFSRGEFNLSTPIEEWALEVTNVSGFNVTFTYQEMADTDLIIFVGAVSQCRVTLAHSSNATYGYSAEATETNCLYAEATGVVGSMTFIVSSAPLITLELNDFYDDTVIKGIPPKFKFLGMFANQMIGMATKDNEQVDTLYWSDLGVGSSIESFAPFDYQTIGKSDEGDSTGVFANTDHVVVFKGEDIYYLYGILYGKQYRIVKANSSGVGCISHKTIKKLMGGCVFLSERGFYHTAGQNPEELSDAIEPTIQAKANKENSYVEIDYFEERVFIVFEDEVFEYNYYFKDWFTGNEIMNGDASLLMIGKDRYIIDNDMLSKQGTTFNHLASWRSAWQVGGEPMMTKKFNSGAILSAYGSEFDVSMKTYSDWSSVAEDSGITDSISSTNLLAKIDCNDKISYAKSFEFNGTELDEDFVISCAAYEAEQYQTRMKDR